MAAVLRILGDEKGNGTGRESSQETIAIIQFRDDGGSVQVGCRQNSETWWDSGYNLRMTRFFSLIGSGEREKERNQKQILEFWPEQQEGRICHQLRRRLSMEQILGRTSISFWTCWVRNVY